MNLYTENEDAGNAYRAKYREQLDALIDQRYRQARERRLDYFQPNYNSPAEYIDSVMPFRERLIELLGWPLRDRPDHVAKAREQQIGEDDLGRIYRMWIEVLPGLEFYGLLFVPHDPGPHPLVIAQHGGAGASELAMALFSSANYNNMGQRVRRHGAITFAPQLPIWSEMFGPPAKHQYSDHQLKHLGGSIAAMNIFQLQQSLDVLIARDDVDEHRVGMTGLSWGGFYTMMTTALDTRINAACASAFVNTDVTTAQIPEQLWRGAAYDLHFAEIAGLICPRPFYCEIGENDEHKVVTDAATEAERMGQWYEKLGIADQFCFNIHPGAHEYSKTDEGIEFLFNALNGNR